MKLETLQKAKELENKLNEVKAVLNGFESTEKALVKVDINMAAEAKMNIQDKDDFIGAKFKSLLVQYEEFFLDEIDKL